MKIRLADKSVKALKPRDERYFVQVEGTPGLMLRVKTGGGVDFVYRYQYRGRRRSMTLGSYPTMTVKQALAKYGKTAEKIEKGIDPLDERAASLQQAAADPTIKEFASRYLENHVQTKLKPKTAAEYRRQFDKYILPHIGSIHLKDIRRAHIKTLVERFAKKTPVMANRVLATIKGLYTYAVQCEVIDFSPAAGITPPGREQVKDRYLDLAEIGRMVKALAGVPMDSRDVMLMILFTGQRPGEVGAMRLSQIREDEGGGKWWEMPAGSTKSGRSHRVYLNEQARQVIQVRRDDNLTNNFLFPSMGKTPYMRIDTLRNRVARVQPIMQAADIPWFTAHDLRRTAATGIARLGYGSVVPDILNHSQQGSVTRRIYDHYSREPEIRRALIAWGNTIQQLINGSGESSVIQVDFQ